MGPGIVISLLVRGLLLSQGPLPVQQVPKAHSQPVCKLLAGHDTQVPSFADCAERVLGAFLHTVELCFWDSCIYIFIHQYSVIFSQYFTLLLHARQVARVGDRTTAGLQGSKVVPSCPSPTQSPVAPPLFPTYM